VKGGKQKEENENPGVSSLLKLVGTVSPLIKTGT
jgi:hypothetical protein